MHLSIASNQLGPAGILAVSRALRGRREPLLTLDARANSLEGIEMDTVALHELAALGASIQSLDVRGNRLGASGWAALLRAVCFVANTDVNSTNGVPRCASKVWTETTTSGHC